MAKKNPREIKVKRDHVVEFSQAEVRAALKKAGYVPSFRGTLRATINTEGEISVDDHRSVPKKVLQCLQLEGIAALRKKGHYIQPWHENEVRAALGLKSRRSPHRLEGGPVVKSLREMQRSGLFRAGNPALGEGTFHQPCMECETPMKMRRLKDGTTWPDYSQRGTVRGPTGKWYCSQKCYEEGEDLPMEIRSGNPRKGIGASAVPRPGDSVIMGDGTTASVRQFIGATVGGRMSSGEWAVKVHGKDRLYYVDPASGGGWVAGGEDFQDDDPYLTRRGNAPQGEDVAVGNQCPYCKEFALIIDGEGRISCSACREDIPIGPRRSGGCCPRCCDAPAGEDEDAPGFNCTNYACSCHRAGNPRLPIHTYGPDEDQPATCPMCGLRTEMESQARDGSYTIEKCPNRKCGYRFRYELDRSDNPSPYPRVMTALRRAGLHGKLTNTGGGVMVIVCPLSGGYEILVAGCEGSMPGTDAGPWCVDLVGPDHSEALNSFGQLNGPNSVFEAARSLKDEAAHKYGARADNPGRPRHAEDEDSNGAPSCPACGGDGNVLGQLGRLDWFRCRQCGMDFSRKA